MEQVVGTQGMQFSCQFRAAETHNLVGMYLDTEAHLLCGTEQPAGLFHGEDTSLAEDVAVLGKHPLLDEGQHLPDEEVDVVVFPSLVFRGDGMRSQEGRHDVDLAYRVEVDALHHFQLFQFGVAVEPVPALAFHGGDSHLAHRMDEPLRLVA